ncbi:hypothetical protein [Streptomyces marispadix]|uniref:Uncharacterized protein n=1 Tax=Streptomyces marispadix TaxID=2922868 RepID=A0ABS9T0P4_9ACTN|nr:hypothetical protein [Streptomyces marispadix]MCH6162106.1 hypothetical protein [Streptomyces marispadix]
MPAEDRAREPGAPPTATGESGVSMRALLASCAAADAVSTPPSDAETLADGADGADGPGGADDLDGERPVHHHGQDAA